MSIESNFAKISQRVKRAEQERGEKIYLVGATKTRTVEEIERAIACGLEIIGENRPQEFRDKYPLLCGKCEMHLIGPLQENKIKYVVGKAALIHSVDSLEIAMQIDACAAKSGVVQNCLIELNISEEESKHGFSKEQIFKAAKQLKTLDNVRFRGLMTILPKIETGMAEVCAERAQQVFSELTALFPHFEIFSAGMSDDYEIALRHGSNMVRIGRGIFGERA